jgi:hypothetical protein
MIIYVPLLVSIVGLVIYALSTQAKPAEVGRLMFACGLLAWLLQHAYTVNPLR